jgi:4-amino-4-deoxy-L-arabinose transferase-like glycosyltransferase
MNKEPSRRVIVKREYLIAGLIFSAAFLLRVFDLERFPLHHDEANRMLAGADQFTFFLGIPVSCFKGYVWPFSSFLISISRNFFVFAEYAVRMPAVIFGTLTVALVYFLCRVMYGRTAAVFSALLLAFLPWHIYQSRDGREMIYVPFFGTLLFLIIFLSMRIRSRALFILFCFLLGASSFYTYGASLAHILASLIIIAWLRKEFMWLSRGAILFGILVFIATFIPIAYLHLSGKIAWATFRGYHKNPFSGPVFFNLLINIRHNLPLVIKSLFISSKGMLLYAASFSAPLLINTASIAVIMLAFFKMAIKRRVSDKIIIVWLFSAVIGSSALMSFFLPEYIIAAQAPLIIIMGSGMAIFYDFVIGKAGKAAAIILTAVMLSFLLILSLWQSINFYRYGPYDFEVCRKNSYGCKDAALFLSRIPGISKDSVITDTRMTTLIYLDHILKRQAYAVDKNLAKYYVVWAPASHPQDYWDGIFACGYKMFSSRFPGKVPIYTVVYPNGVPALYVYKADNMPINAGNR